MPNIVPISDLKNSAIAITVRLSISLRTDAENMWCRVSRNMKKMQATVKQLAELSKGSESICTEGVVSIDEAFADLEV